MVGDPIGDFITQLKNAGMAGKERVSVPYSKLKHAIADKLAERGFVGEVAKRGRKTRKFLDVELRYDGTTSRLAHVERISKPGRREYRSVSTIRLVRYGKGTLVLSTPKGILTGEEARKERVGGEALFQIW